MTVRKLILGACLIASSPGFAASNAPVDGVPAVTVSNPATAAAQSAPSVRQADYIHLVQDTVKSGSLYDYEDLQMERSRVLAAAQWPRVSIVLKPLTGPTLDRLRITFFNSFDEFGDAAKALAANPALAAKLKKIDAREASLLQSRVEIDIRYRPKISYHGDFNWADMRYLSMIKIHLIPGHGFEYEQNRDIVIKAHNDAELVENLAIYTVNSGSLSSSYRIIRPVTSLKGFDGMDSMHGERYESVLGKANQLKLHELFAASVQTEEEEYYALDNRSSYTTPVWAGADNGFWNSAQRK